MFKATVRKHLKTKQTKRNKAVTFTEVTLVSNTGKNQLEDSGEMAQQCRALAALPENPS